MRTRAMMYRLVLAAGVAVLGCQGSFAHAAGYECFATKRINAHVRVTTEFLLYERGDDVRRAFAINLTLTPAQVTPSYTRPTVDRPGELFLRYIAEEGLKGGDVPMLAKVDLRTPFVIFGDFPPTLNLFRIDLEIHGQTKTKTVSNYRSLEREHDTHWQGRGLWKTPSTYGQAITARYFMGVPQSRPARYEATPMVTLHYAKADVEQGFSVAAGMIKTLEGRIAKQDCLPRRVKDDA